MLEERSRCYHGDIIPNKTDFRLVKLKPQAGIITLPKFENYTNETNKSNFILKQNVEDHVFEWQEKKFSAWEVHQYSDSFNCVTDIELAYHDMLKEQEHAPSKVFSYIHDDNYISLPFDNKKRSKDCGLSLNTILEQLRLNEKFPVFSGNSKRSDSLVHVFKSEEKMLCGNDEQWTAMHIVYDNSEYDENTRLLVKEEAIFISLYHNLTHNYLIASPDTNSLEFNPYGIVTETGLHLQYHYEVDFSFDCDGGGEELMILLRKLSEKWEKKQRHLVNFLMPPFGVKKFYLTLEILTAAGFEMDNLYTEYHVKIPEGVQCSDILHGRTHSSKPIRVDQLDQCNFGHILELEMDINIGLDPPTVQFFFEVISTDFWCRHRTEGYSYLALSLSPGRYAKQLSCSRPEETDKVEAASRRFFVGGCHLIKDLEVLAKPQLMDANFTFQNTGTIKLRWNVISQTTTPGSVAASPQPGTSTSSELLQGAETALRKYSKARAKLAAATKDLEVTCGVTA